MIEESPNPEVLEALELLVIILREARVPSACEQARLDRYEAYCKHPYVHELRRYIGSMHLYRLLYALAE